MYGVGVIGAGPGAASLHVPTIARIPAFRVTHISDSGSGRAAALAKRLAARSSVGSEELLADPDVQVVAICSPPHRHAEQILAAVAAGARGILCEKPLAVTADEAERVIDACRAAGVALVVGTNHHADPAWGRARHHLVANGSTVSAVSVTVALPPNSRYHAVVSQPPSDPPGPAGGRPLPDFDDPQVAADVVRQLVIGLGVHDLPTLRDLAPRIDRVVWARPLPPIGFALGARAGDVAVQFTAVMTPGGADALWRMSVIADDGIVDVDFPPAFVHVGSADVSVRIPGERTTSYAGIPEDGYLAQWRTLAAQLSGDLSVEYDALLDDALYAVELADAAASAVRAGGGRG